MTRRTSADDQTGGVAEPRFVLFVVSSYSVGERRIRQLRASVRDHAGVPADLIRLDTGGPDLLTMLDELAAEGWCHIRVQPLGLPMSDSLLHWLPGVLAHWREHRGSGVRVDLGSDQVAQQEGWDAFLQSVLAEPAQPVDAATDPALGKPGWSEVPAFRHHLLVCAGPRCQIHGAMPLLQQLQTSCRHQGVYRDCLITRTGCMAPCNQGPVVALYPRGAWYRLPDAEAVDAFVREVLVENGDGLRFCVHQMASAQTNSNRSNHAQPIEIIASESGTGFGSGSSHRTGSLG